MIGTQEETIQTAARIAGNMLSWRQPGVDLRDRGFRVAWAIQIARVIQAEVKRQNFHASPKQ